MQTQSHLFQFFFDRPKKPLPEIRAVRFNRYLGTIAYRGVRWDVYNDPDKIRIFDGKHKIELPSKAALDRFLGYDEVRVITWVINDRMVTVPRGTTKSMLKLEMRP